MGAPMAKRLVDWPGGLTVFDVRPEAMTPLGEAGARWPTASPTSPTADVISVTVLNDAQVRDVVRRDSPRTPSRARSSRSTRRSSPTPPVELAEQLRPKGIHIVDAPVSGGAGAAEKGELAVMVGRRRRGRTSWSSRFEQWASLVVHAGEPGAGTRMKLARNMLTFIAFAAACEARSSPRRRASTCRSSARWCGTPTRKAAGPARSWSATTRNRLQPDDFLLRHVRPRPRTRREGSQPGARAR